ncbi:molybdopterin-dependent oxidoreductase [Aeromicrobium sp. CF4.19]|uniref:molybdopterin-dependent oxidoreductase n=1 Tax=Aeromicrobium sp. CF4.19 TaxID=3373082 RepID=UPI003EE66F8D
MTTTESTERSARSRATAPWWAGVLAGVLAATCGVALGSGLAALFTGVPTPIESVGNRFIDLTPPWLKDFAIEQFGDNDKAVLIGGTVVTLLLLAAVAGFIGLRRPPVAFALTAVLGLVALVTAAMDRTATAPRALVLLPALVTLAVSLIALGVMLRALELTPKPGDDVPGTFDRRAFMRAVLATSAGIVVGGAAWRFLGSRAAAEARESVSLPRPADPAPAVPAGAQADVDGISPYITPNKDFYRIDTALRVPQVPIEGYSLRIHGMVDNELNLSFRDLLAERLVERRITLTCVSNEVGGPYVGNAAWLGVLTSELLERAGVQDGADAVLSRSADDMTIGTPLDALTDDRESLIAIGMNGEPLPLEHGFPVRMVVPGLYGYVSATKWLVDIEVSRFQDFEAYWTPRGYSAEAPIKMSSRIDVPRSFAALPRDNVRIGGVAWAQDTGIERVEVQIDDGSWQDAELADEDTINTWRQWSWTWQDATEGTHSVTVRATDAQGETQTSERARILPDGTTGWHSVQFRVE